MSVQPNEWVAVHPSDDVTLLARRVSSAYERFLADSAGPDVRSVVRASWLRARTDGVDPDLAGGPTSLTGAELEAYRSSHPMALIRPVVQRLLVEDATDAGLIVAIGDAQGRLLWVEGESSARDKALAMNFAPGADWSERSVGTNAPGTALALDHSVQIFAAEHFSRVAHDWSCTAAPVHDPVSGRTLGAIDITGGPRVEVPEVLALVKATVAAAESELRLRLLEHPELLAAGTPRVELLAERPAFVRSGARIPLSRRHAELVVILTEHPEGLSAEELAVLLDESDLDAVTVRAEISRLRRIVGSDLVLSRPYRLSRTLRTDIDDLRAALDQGSVSPALDSYTRPLLPESTAPGVYRLREELRSRMRHAVLRSRNSGFLSKWANSVDGRDDIDTWTAYLATIDPRSPLHSQIRARVDMLEREFGRARFEPSTFRHRS